MLKLVCEILAGQITRMSKKMKAMLMQRFRGDILKALLLSIGKCRKVERICSESLLVESFINASCSESYVLTRLKEFCKNALQFNRGISDKISCVVETYPNLFSR
ncbi:hypothetical protein CARUB_v10006093mg [Capsella rubella]|uniref:Uncharacterized protein n=1 Tax=Capsella rubella TaxID=81985 RepID=R0GLE9_9BRAS|nr:hypothetical protein CARUB_v10006093mg [Capsella rubella]